MVQPSCAIVVLEAACGWSLLWAMQVQGDGSGIKPTVPSSSASQSCQYSVVWWLQKNGIKSNIWYRSHWDCLLLMPCLISTATLTTASPMFLILCRVNRVVTASTSYRRGKSLAMSTSPGPGLTGCFCSSQGLCQNKLWKDVSNPVVLHCVAKFSADISKICLVEQVY